ncbi:hypothetical protein [Sinomicrobium sp. M5D2P17]
MKKYPIYRFSLLLMGLFALQAQAQKESKTFRESFPVNKDVTVEVNTSHSDVQFETWNENTVEVVATVEVEGLSKEGAKKYFESWDFRATGDKNKIQVSTHPGNVFVLSGFPAIPEIPEPIEVPIPPVPPMPPKMPDMSGLTFDYEAYKEDGDAYMEEWKKKMKTIFDEDFKENMKEWKKEMEERSQEMKVSAEKIKAKVKESQKDMKVFYFSKDGSEEEIKIQNGQSGKQHINIRKSILIRIPKGAKLKMNVRHGEVKLAENSVNVRATLSHASLLANQVKGKDTSIETSYAPVLVHNWNGGKLKVNYVKKVDLENVTSLELISNTSDVTVNNLLYTGHIQGTFGNLQINNIGNDFRELDITLDNTNAVIALPRSGFSILLNSENSEIKIPSDLKVSTSGNTGNTVVKGNTKENNSGGQITVQAKYSDVKFN